MSELRKAIVEYLAAQDMLHNAHEARLAVGTDWGALNQRHVAASHRLTELLTSPEPDPETAILAAAESLHRERWPNESSAYDPANDPECRPIIEQAVRAALAAAPLPSDTPADGLDVSRLELAIEAAGCTPSCGDCGADISYHSECAEGDGTLVWEVDAAAVAHGYAALAKEPRS